MSEPWMGRPPPDFEKWYEEVSDGLTQRIAAAVGDPILGREIAAEAFARAFDHWSRVAKMKSPSGWVFRTAMNLSKRRWRRRAIERRALAKLHNGLVDLTTQPAGLGGPFSEEPEVDGHYPDEVLDLVAELPDRMQMAIRLRYWGSLSEAEVAEQMNTSVGTASATLSNARKRLEALLRERKQREWER